MQEVEGRRSEAGEEKSTLEGMVESRDELITEIAMKIGLEHMGEDAEDEDEDGNDGGDAAAPPVAVAPPLLLRHMLLPHLRRLSRRKTL
jgi:hypothetical protein